MNGKRMPEQSGIFCFLKCQQLSVIPERHRNKDDEHLRIINKNTIVQEMQITIWAIWTRFFYFKDTSSYLIRVMEVINHDRLHPFHLLHADIVFMHRFKLTVVHQQTHGCHK
ncbi:hypothetical protein [Paenibacillus sp. Soil724D2]|uniref:hypothetical protein n=1 Tax=Paenibacillus sp. (strain Soil724D2) TaxID=1736392 RepID=UPI000712AB01|nr:hypothetical protein [Paenibacillus sp. Soil724D2]KRE46562.1 hypothetical protein ASG85_29630 [Paenibacillus sp. Soil724D2]